MTDKHVYEVQDSRNVYTGRVISLRRDEVTMPGGTIGVREVVEHPGAVGVLALDDQGQIAIVVQYRHPVRERLWELPAGILDVPGEPAYTAAARELVEEAGLHAATWNVLVDTLPSPGMSDEGIRIYLARDLSFVPRPDVVDEETEMDLVWIPLAEAVERCLDGRIRNAMAINGILATATTIGTGFAGLRPYDAPWPDRHA